MLTKRILIIDDEDDIRAVAQASLEIMRAWEVLTASSSCEGLVKAAAEQPDAILLDVMLPDMDGTATFKLLQKDPATAQIPVIFLTAKARSTDRRQLADLGAAAVLTKPFEPEELADQMAAALGWE